MEPQDIFCKIIGRDVEDSRGFDYRDADIAVIHDINPQAPIHLLIIPIKHFKDLSEFTAADAPLLGKVLLVAEQMAKENGLENGYRIITNKGMDGGQAVPHLHFHLLGGKPLGPKLVK